MKRMIRASYNGDEGKFFDQIPEVARHNGKKRWRLLSPDRSAEIVVSWRQKYYDCSLIQSFYHRRKGYELGFIHKKFRATDTDLEDFTVISEI